MHDNHSELIKRRKYDKIPVVICEWHQDVLPHIHRAIGSRHLPESGLKMIHFDSHPDLTFPINLPAEQCFNKDAIYDELEIADWILPLVYENHLKELVWIKPPWASQIRDGKFNVSVGENRENQFLRISCEENYFLEELLYSNDKDLCKSKKLDILIETMTSNGQKKLAQSHYSETDSKQQESYKERTASQEQENTSNEYNMEHADFILDIDLDFFSTYNPFVLRFSKVDFEDIVRIYKFSPPRSTSREDIEEALHNRQEQLVKLQSTIKYFEDNIIGRQECRTDLFNLIHLDNHGISKGEICSEYFHLLQRIHEKEVTEGKEIDLEMVHFAGMSSNLPHHRSTEAEIDELMHDMEEFLKLQSRPTLITIARSTEDDYTPSDQVDAIQCKVIDMLQRLYTQISLDKDYVHSSEKGANCSPQL